MAATAFLTRATGFWRSLASRTRVRILLLTLAGVSVALRDVLLLASAASLLALHEATRLTRRAVPTAAL